MPGVTERSTSSPLAFFRLAPRDQVLELALRSTMFGAIHAVERLRESNACERVAVVDVRESGAGQW